jgi:hypothetical protein
MILALAKIAAFGDIFAALLAIMRNAFRYAPSRASIAGGA